MAFPTQCDNFNKFHIKFLMALFAIKRKMTSTYVFRSITQYHTTGIVSFKYNFNLLELKMSCRI